MISVYIREQKRYTLKELSGLLVLPEEKTDALVSRLAACGIVKKVRQSDYQRNLSELDEDDPDMAEPLAEGEDCYYVFTCVGVVTAACRVLKCFPKYLPEDSVPVREMKRIIRVLEKYGSGGQLVRLHSGSSEPGKANLLPISLALLKDYHENGEYSNLSDRIESNGPGEILWEKTVHETYALISRNSVCYPDLRTHRRTKDDNDYFHRLHACVLSCLSAELDRTDLPELFDIATVSLSEEHPGDFGDLDDILDRIEKELNVEFGTRKQFVLKAMYAWLSGNSGILDPEGLAFFGTRGFNLVWEAVCSDVLNNRLRDPLGSLPLLLPLRPGYDRNMKLIDVIEKPVWAVDGTEAEGDDTLVPDAVAFERNGRECRFLIFDAKYYRPRLVSGKTPEGMPGIESVTKQYLYQLAFKKFLEEHGVDRVENSFLFPSAGGEVEDRGTVSLPMMDALGLKKIRILFLPADLMFSCYISGRKLKPADILL